MKKKIKCYFSFDGSCDKDAEWICPECGRAMCNEDAKDGDVLDRCICLGECFDKNIISDLVMIDYD